MKSYLEVGNKFDFLVKKYYGFGTKKTVMRFNPKKMKAFRLEWEAFLREAGWTEDYWLNVLENKIRGKDVDLPF